MAKKEEITLPTEEEIIQLPRWAIVAFAARCARCVEYLFPLYWKKAPTKYREAVTRAIEVAENPINATTDSAIAAAEAAGEAADAAIKSSKSTRAAYVISTAAFAAYAAAEAIGNATGEAATSAAEAINAAVEAAEAAEATTNAAKAESRDATLIRVIINCDFYKLKIAAKKKKLTDDSFVPPSFFLPLKHFDKLSPQDRIEILRKMITQSKGNRKRDYEQGLSTQVVVPDYVSEKQVIKELIGLFHDLSEYHIACGGNGLVIHDFQTFTREGALVGVGR